MKRKSFKQMTETVRWSLFSSPDSVLNLRTQSGTPAPEDKETTGINQNSYDRFRWTSVDATATPPGDLEERAKFVSPQKALEKNIKYLVRRTPFGFLLLSLLHRYSFSICVICERSRQHQVHLRLWLVEHSSFVGPNATHRSNWFPHQFVGWKNWRCTRKPKEKCYVKPFLRTNTTRELSG